MITLSYKSGNNVHYSNGDTTMNVFGEPITEMINLQAISSKEPDIKNISWPGEYDFAGIAVTGIGHNQTENVSYLLVYDNIKTAFVVAPLHDWSEHDIEMLGDVDILVLPVASGKLVQKLVDEIDPRVLVLVPGDAPEELADAQKAVGVSGKEPQAEYKLKGNLPAEGREVIVFG